MSLPKHIVLLTPGQPSSNPRLTKEAIALAAEGYRVTVFYSFWVGWATVQDQLIVARNPSVQWTEIGGNPVNRRTRYFFSRAIHKCYRLLSILVPAFLPFAVRAEIRTYDAMLYAATTANADLYIGHNLGGLAVAGRAAALRKALYGFDAEDFHRGQTNKDSHAYRRTKIIEDRYLPAASYITAASPLIAAAYKKLYSVEPVVINNVFSNKYSAKEIEPVQLPVKLFWFSQTIGRQRGLEDVIAALKEFSADTFELTLLGYCSNEMKLYLQEIGVSKDRQNVKIKFLDPVDPDAIFAIAAKYDIGLALEPGRDENNRIALSNKLFTYLLAGNAVIFSATPAQDLFYSENRGVGSVYKCGDINALISLLKKYADNPDLVMSQKSAARHLAAKKYHWEQERELLFLSIEQLLK